jgi:hypothetical protein
MKGFIYNEETRNHKLDGLDIPSVTQVIPDEKFYCTPEQLETARDEGIDNHSAIKMYNDTGETFGNPLLIAYEKWLKEYDGMLGNLICYERPMFSIKGFCGRPDTIFEYAIVDFKRGPGDKKRRVLQLAGYSILVQENLKMKTKIWISAYFNGKKIIAKNIYDPQAESIFISLVRKWQIEQTLKKFMEG